MNDKRHNQRRDVQWQSVTEEFGYSLGLISFHNLVLTEHLTRIVDRSFIGIGIESDHSIEPGFILFRKSVYGQKCGILMWCRQTGTGYRCGIQFLSLTLSEEDYLRYLIERSAPSAQIQDPDRVIANLNDCFLKC